MKKMFLLFILCQALFMTACQQQYNVPQTDNEPENFEDSNISDKQDYNEEGAPAEISEKAQLYEGIYSDNRLFGDSDREDYPSTAYEIVISNVTDTTFDFAVYENNIATGESALISPKHTAVFSGDGTEATYHGDDYNLTFTFPDYHGAYPVVTDIEISGFAPFEGKTYVNNSIPGYEFA